MGEIDNVDRSLVHVGHTKDYHGTVAGFVSTLFLGSITGKVLRFNQGVATVLP